MKREFAFCYEDQDRATARQLMPDRGLQVLPVVDPEMRILGIFTREENAEKAETQAAGEK